MNVVFLICIYLMRLRLSISLFKKNNNRWKKTFFVIKKSRICDEKMTLDGLQFSCSEFSPIGRGNGGGVAPFQWPTQNLEANF